jgi:hypothetical protein
MPIETTTWNFYTYSNISQIESAHQINPSNSNTQQNIRKAHQYPYINLKIIQKLAEWLKTPYSSKEEIFVYY